MVGFKVLNPPEFSKEYLVEIAKVTCNYKLRGKTIVDGLKLFRAGSEQRSIEY